MDSYIRELARVATRPRDEAMAFWNAYYDIRKSAQEYEEDGYKLCNDDGKLCLAPISALTALELYKRGNIGEIYRIYEDGTEGAVYDLDDIVAHSIDGGMFAIDVL